MTITKVNYAVICDDVRREDTGKMIFIGVYGSDIQFSAYPAILRMHLAIHVTAESAGTHPLELQTIYDDVVQNVARITIGIQKPGVALFSVGPIVAEIKKDGVLAINLKIGDRDFGTVATMPVRLRQSATVSNEMPPPSEQSPPAAS